MLSAEIDRAMAALAWLAGAINAANWNDVWTLAGWPLVGEALGWHWRSWRWCWSSVDRWLRLGLGWSVRGLRGM